VSGMASSSTGGEANTSDGVAAPSSSIPRRGRTTSPSTSAAKRRPAIAQLAKRTTQLGPRTGTPCWPQSLGSAGPQRLRTLVSFDQSIGS